MAAIPQLTSANTFLQWRGNMNEASSRLNEHTTGDTTLHSNTLTANTTLNVVGPTKNLLVANGAGVGNVAIGASSVSAGFKFEVVGQLKCVPTDVLTIANSAGSVVKTINGIGA